MNVIFKFQKIADRTNDYQLEKKQNKLFSKKEKWVATEKSTWF